MRRSWGGFPDGRVVEGRAGGGGPDGEAGRPGRRPAAGRHRCRQAGVVPTLAIVRVGERPEDLSYERGAVKRCEKVGIAVKRFILSEDASQEELTALLRKINGTPEIHGCLLFRPLPRHMDEGAVCAALSPAKDVDGITPGSLASVFSGDRQGYPPCTAQACMELLDYYGYDLTGRRAVVVGRSLVIGRPAAMLLLGRNATVTLCHTRTADLAAECRRAEVLIAAKNRSVEEVRFEVADLMYHLTVLLADQGMSWDDIYAELENRHR